MRKLFWILLCSSLILTPFVLSGCGERSTEVVVNEKEELAVPVVQNYPPYSFYLNVPWIAQVPPGSWSGTKNCGQACGVMLGGYFNGGSVQPWVITAENQMLHQLTGDSRYLQPNGWYTGGSRLWAFREMLRRFHGLQTEVHNGNHADDVINEVANGKPVIVGVMIKNGQIVCSGGESHWVVAIGWNGRIILHDPGSSSGAFRVLSVAAFECSWATQGKVYIPVSR